MPKDVPFGQLVYREYEYSFDFIPAQQSEIVQRSGRGGTTSLLIGTLHIEVGIETRLALFVWGLHSHNSQWVRAPLSPVSPRSGYLQVVFDQEPITGVSQALTESAHVRTIYDPDSGWIRLSFGDDQTEHVYSEFAQDMVAGLLEEKLVSLWLRPAWFRERFEEEGVALFDQLN